VSGQRVVVVTGGGGGIGAAIAEELGRRGDLVVTVDPLVTLDGQEQLPQSEATTAERIVAAGGSARASSVSVTDGPAVEALFGELVEEHGRLDAVVNVAGISRPTGYARGTADDWRSVIAVHLDGYLNVLGAALPLMASAGRGTVLGVTSGSGWRAADAGAYGCAKRAVAALTWQLGAQAPPGVTVNAMSPIAMTRMVTAALERSRGAAGSSAAGNLSLGSMPRPDELGPTGAHLVGDGFSWCSGQVIFACGSEVAVVDPPRLLEVVRTTGTDRLAPALEAASAAVLAPVEALQASGGGSNSRTGAVGPTDALPPAAVGSCLLVTDRPGVAATVTAALAARGVTTSTIGPADPTTDFDGAAAALAAAVERDGVPDAVVVALAGSPVSPGSGGHGSDWERVLAEHAGLADDLCIDAGWTRAAADHAVRSSRQLRLVTLVDATSGGGRSRAQASAQLARAAASATDGLVTSFSVSIETTVDAAGAVLGEVVAHLLCSPGAPGLAGAELVIAADWFGLRSHPRARGSVTFGGPAVPDWLDDALRGIVG
jgi:NAD(P)-dependent dehydrogenase (short-subunit alcohol dehydrogenase family)